MVLLIELRSLILLPENIAVSGSNFRLLLLLRWRGFFCFSVGQELLTAAGIDFGIDFWLEAAIRATLSVSDIDFTFPVDWEGKGLSVVVISLSDYSISHKRKRREIDTWNWIINVIIFSNSNKAIW